MKKKVELPIVEPIYSTYHCQSCGAATIHKNPSIRNWYLSEAVNLKCNRKFLSDSTTPEIDIVMSNLNDNPHLNRHWITLQFANVSIHSMIRKIIDKGFYVYFMDFDDYYIEGKTWYKQKHFYNDGLICGYDQEKMTYSIYAYDNKWVCHKFKTTQESFNDGYRAAMKNNGKGSLCAIKPKLESVVFNPITALERIKEYLDSSLEKYPLTEKGNVFGIVVHDYIGIYLEKLVDGSIPYNRMDWRVFHLIWEHKKAMLERMKKIEKALELDSKVIGDYGELVIEADTMRMLYASYHIKRRDNVLPIIQKKLIAVKEKELEVLTRFVRKVENVILKCRHLPK